MEQPTPGAIAYRTPDELEGGMVIVPPGFAGPETVKRTRFAGRCWIVRTFTNVHRVDPLTRVPVLAEFVPGIGWVTKQQHDDLAQGEL